MTTNAKTIQTRATCSVAYLVLAGEALPGGLTARPDRLSYSRPGHLVLPQQVHRALQLVFGLPQARRVNPKFIQEHFRHLAVGPDREVIMLSIRLENFI